MLNSGCKFDNNEEIGFRQNELYVKTISGVLRLNSFSPKDKPGKIDEISDVNLEYKRTFGISLKCDINQKLNYVW